MISRRRWLGLTLGAGAAWSLNPRLLLAAQQAVATRAIPSSGEQVPVIGLGSSATFAQVASSEDVAKLKAVLQTLIDKRRQRCSIRLRVTGFRGGRRPYRAGTRYQQAPLLGHKVNVAGRGGGTADPAAARAQIEQSFKRFAVDRIDLIQVHNMGDVATSCPSSRNSGQGASSTSV